MVGGYDTSEKQRALVEFVALWGLVKTFHRRSRPSPLQQFSEIWEKMEKENLRSVDSFDTIRLSLLTSWEGGGVDGAFP